MGKKSRDKGARIEREIVNLHRENSIFAERVPMSGASAYTHDADIDVYLFWPEDPYKAEVKARANGEGFKTLEKWLGDNELLFLRKDRGMPLVVMPWNIYMNIVRRIQGD